MSAALMQAIQQRWGESAGLSALVPAERVSTGASPSPALPRAVLSKQSHQPLAACNDGSAVSTVGVRIEVFHANYDAAAAVVRQLAAVLDRADFPLPDGGRVINMRKMNDTEEQHSDGTWQMAVDFACTLYCPAPLTQ
jgi:hypothetical protein